MSDPGAAVGGLLSGGSSGGQAAGSGIADIPPGYLSLYVAAAATCPLGCQNSATGVDLVF